MIVFELFYADATQPKIITIHEITLEYDNPKETGVSTELTLEIEDTNYPDSTSPNLHIYAFTEDPEEDFLSLLGITKDELLDQCTDLITKFQ